MPRRRSYNYKVSEEGISVDEIPVVAPVEQSYNSIVQIQSLFPAHISYRGLVTGQLYVWSQAGSIQPVDERDVADLLSKRIGSNACCGGSGQGNQVFQRL